MARKSRSQKRIERKLRQGTSDKEIQLEATRKAKQRERKRIKRLAALGEPLPSLLSREVFLLKASF